MSAGERRLQAVLGLKGGRTPRQGACANGDATHSLELVGDMFKWYF